VGKIQDENDARWSIINQGMNGVEVAGDLGQVI
jgi:hypothetical protein